jgi:hypothetical protein
MSGDGAVLFFREREAALDHFHLKGQFEGAIRQPPVAV